MTNALKIENQANPLRVWAAGERAGAITTAQQGLTNALHVVPSTRSVLVAGGREAAETIARARVLQTYPSAAAAASRAINVTRGGIVLSSLDHLHLADDLVKLPGKVRELVGGGKEGGG